MVNFLTVRIDDKKCEHCLTCVSECPTGALTYYKAGFMHSAYECSYCESCMMVCPNDAINILDM
ncbi:MAG: 4Fe-4S binding protein [Methanobrevibacter sp.]|nr:4Fe-4S binding protein [Methanobrevibacter sp.]MBQ9024940.1 4Fe-4S binding protein [Methanobrevibacter sp.]